MGRSNRGCGDLPRNSYSESDYLHGCGYLRWTLLRTELYRLQRSAISWAQCDLTNTYMILSSVASKPVDAQQVNLVLAIDTDAFYSHLLAAVQGNYSTAM